jgi:hypothetical protein
MWLTGRPDGPALGAPGALVDLVAHAASALHAGSAGLATLDGLALLGERAALSNLSRRGDISCGGSTRLVRAADGWLAVSLARTDDIAALPAWLESSVPDTDPWATVTEAVAVQSASVLDQRAALLGLPIAALASVPPPDDPAFGLPITARPVARAGGPLLDITEATVIDLSSLWAGPLCGQLLADAGARVIKVESTGRPDGARGGPSSFFDLLNGQKRSVVLDLHSPAGRRDLRRLIAAADVVIESARPRALEQLGIDAAEVLAQAPGPRVWASITSHGRRGTDRERVGFGDVAAVGGGLATHDAQGPCFIGDAVTDPLTGLVAAAAVLEALAAGGHWLIDAAMAPLAATVAGEPLPVGGAVAEPPRARPVPGPASPLGSDTAAVLAELDA